MTFLNDLGAFFLFSTFKAKSRVTIKESILSSLKKLQSFFPIQLAKSQPQSVNNKNIFEWELSRNQALFKKQAVIHIH